jgi:hypothetical protein
VSAAAEERRGIGTIIGQASGGDANYGTLPAGEHVAYPKNGFSQKEIGCSMLSDRRARDESSRGDRN